MMANLIQLFGIPYAKLDSSTNSCSRRQSSIPAHNAAGSRSTMRNRGDCCVCEGEKQSSSDDRREAEQRLAISRQRRSAIQGRRRWLLEDSGESILVGGNLLMGGRRLYV
ncbi:hypothetical protein L1887_08374 [Cichorium endivia]|nr:hypothetical protein L1887_08374 [Cichorium endivia]